MPRHSQEATDDATRWAQMELMRDNKRRLEGRPLSVAEQRAILVDYIRRFEELTAGSKVGLDA